MADRIVGRNSTFGAETKNGDDRYNRYDRYYRYDRYELFPTFVDAELPTYPRLKCR